MIDIIFINLSVLGILGFERRLQTELKLLGAGRKLWELKLFVGASMMLSITFTVL